MGRGDRYLDVPSRLCGGAGPFADVSRCQRAARFISYPGRVISEFEQQFPANWCQSAVDSFGHHALVWKNGADKPNEGAEIAIRRVTNALANSGVTQRAFDDEIARVFRDELAYVLLHQLGTFNRSLWRTVGVSNQEPVCSSTIAFELETTPADLRKAVVIESWATKHGGSTAVCLPSSVTESAATLSMLRGLYETPRAEAAAQRSGQPAGALRTWFVEGSAPSTSDLLDDLILYRVAQRNLLEEGLAGKVELPFQDEQLCATLLLDDTFMSAAANHEAHKEPPSTKIGNRQQQDALKLLRKASTAIHSFGPFVDVAFAGPTNRFNTCVAGVPLPGGDGSSSIACPIPAALPAATLNLPAFVSGAEFDFELLGHVVELLVIALDLSISLATFPTDEVRRGTLDYRPITLGVTGLGAALMAMGRRYDRQDSRIIAAAICSFITATAYRTSARLAAWDRPSSGGMPIENR